jgi:hypothetical protein
LGTKWCGALGIQEGIASTTGSSLESEAESSVSVHEKYGHLQLCLLDVLSSIVNGVRSPQDLGNHSSDTPEDTTVKHRRVLIRKVDDERTAILFQSDTRQRWLEKCRFANWGPKLWDMNPSTRSYR